MDLGQGCTLAPATGTCLFVLPVQDARTSSQYRAYMSSLRLHPDRLRAGNRRSRRHAVPRAIAWKTRLSQPIVCCRDRNITSGLTLRRNTVRALDIFRSAGSKPDSDLRKSSQRHLQYEDNAICTSQFSGLPPTPLIRLGFSRRLPNRNASSQFGFIKRGSLNCCCTTGRPRPTANYIHLENQPVRIDGHRPKPLLL